MFVERLTRKQVKDFLNEIYSEIVYRYDFDYDKIFEQYHVIVYGRDSNVVINSFSLSDFDVIWTTLTSKYWIKYLYKIFGEEYKVAYLAECEKLFK